MKKRFEVMGSGVEIVLRSRAKREFEGNPNYAADAAELYDFLALLPHATIVRLFELLLEDGSLIQANVDDRGGCGQGDR